VGLQTIEAPPLLPRRRHEDIPPRGPVDAGNAVEEGGFPRAVGADQGHHLPGLNLEAYLVQGPETAEIHGQCLDIEEGFRHGVHLCSPGPRWNS